MTTCCRFHLSSTVWHLFFLENPIILKGRWCFGVDWLIRFRFLLIHDIVGMEKRSLASYFLALLSYGVNYIVGESSDANHHNGLMEKLKLTMKDPHFNWFDLRVFYLRISSFQVDDSVPEYLALRLIPIEPENLLQSNSNSFDGFSSILRLARADRRSEEATSVGTNSVRLTRGVKFEVSSQESLILRGVLEMCKRDGSSMVMDQWRITDCEYRAVGFGNGSSRPAMEIYIAGSHAGEPVVLTETLDLDALQSRNDDLQMNLTEFEIEEHNCKFILKKTELAL